MISIAFSPLIAPTAFALGAVGGSFASTAAVRRLRGEGAVLGRSCCDACRVQLSYAATLPVVSFVMRRGRCSRCNGAIPLVHLVSEVAGGLAFALASLLIPPTSWAPLAVSSLLLIYATVVDVRALRLPDLAVLGVATCGFIAATSAGSAVESLATACATGAVLSIAAFVFARVRGRPGLGLGDVKLVAALSIWTGPNLTPIALAAASAAGLAWISLASSRPPDDRIPFGPFIALAFWPFVLGRLAG